MAAEQPREITKGKTEGDFDENMIFFWGGGLALLDQNRL